MREMVVEDIKTGVRTITQLALNNAINNKGIFRTVKTELFDPNFKSTDMSNVTDNNVVNVNYDNYQITDSNTAVGNILFDKIISVLSDGTKVYSFNKNLQVTFNEQFDCDGDSYIGKLFYVDHTVDQACISGFEFKVIEKYDETARIKLFINDELKYDTLLSDIVFTDENTERGRVFIDLFSYYGTRTRWQIFITDNINQESYGKLIIRFESHPENAMLRKDLESREDDIQTE